MFAGALGRKWYCAKPREERSVTWGSLNIVFIEYLWRGVNNEGPVWCASAFAPTLPVQMDLALGRISKQRKCH